MILIKEVWKEDQSRATSRFFLGALAGGVGMTLVPSATSAVIWSPRVVQAPKRRGRERGCGVAPLAHGGLWEEKGVNKAGGCTLGKLFLARIRSREPEMRRVCTCHLISPCHLSVLPAGPIWSL